MTPYSRTLKELYRWKRYLSISKTIYGKCANKCGSIIAPTDKDKEFLQQLRRLEFDSQWLTILTNSDGRIFS